MTKYYPREERLRHLRLWQQFADMYPDLCFVCRKAKGERRKIMMVDYLGGTGEDGYLEAALCDGCLAAANRATQDILRVRASRN